MNTFSTICAFGKISNQSVISYSKRCTIDFSGNNYIDLSNTLMYSRTAAGLNNTAASGNTSFAIMKYNGNNLKSTDLASSINFTMYLKYATKISTLPLFNTYYPSKITIDNNLVLVGGTVTLKMFSLLLYGTPIQYVITGCDAVDISSTSLTGNFISPYQSITYYPIASGAGKTPTISISGGNQITFSIISLVTFTTTVITPPTPTTIGNYKVIQFTTVGSCTITFNKTMNIEVLVVAGGGAGGGTSGGGGGAGGVIYNNNFNVTGGTNYNITVGNGGSANGTLAGNSGSNSIFGSLTAIGGGGGASETTQQTLNTQIAKTGGSGGGGCIFNENGGTGTAGQGNNGGTGNYDNHTRGNGSGGGGGAGEAGKNSATNKTGNGGNGIAINITGSAVYYGGGGGGGTYYNSGTNGSGGLGGGGKGGLGDATNGFAAVSGSPNTGGGGGGRGLSNAFTAGSGGSGIVIIKYPTYAW